MQKEAVKHTPGPWSAHFIPGDGHKNFPEWQIDGDHQRGGLCVGRVNVTGAEVNGYSPAANALLIAAAPELLNACELAIKELQRLQDCSGGCLEAMQLCDMAIKRAKGES